MSIRNIVKNCGISKENFAKLDLSKKDVILYISTIVKYLISFGIFAITHKTTDHRSYICVALAELFIVGFLTNWLATKRYKTAYAINAVFTFLINAQMIVLYFGASFISLIMMTNLDMISDLGGNVGAYGVGAAAVVIAALLPIKSVGLVVPKREWQKGAAIPSMVALWLLGIVLFTTSCSPMAAYVDLGCQYLEYRQYAAQIKAMSKGGIDASAYYSEDVVDAYAKDESLAEQPNIILIFTEGLSQSIVEDERDLMPNYAALEEKSLFVENYFNHTAATFRGILGQLYSGYQYGNYDPNYLISLQSILSDEGYSTTFINTEDNNEEWTQWLNTLGYDQVVSYVEDAYTTDKQAYEYLETVATELNSSSEPFFITLYTFGTHVSWDSPDETYGDGSDPALNRFYNTDCWIGEFLEWFETSELAEDTILIFTADHCAYYNDEFVNAFPDYERTASFCDRVPLCIYYVGIEATTIDANGKNTLDLTPTILDYLDISAENYFLGTSLFDENGSSGYDTIYTIYNETWSTENACFTLLDEVLQEAFDMGLSSYLSLAANGVN